MIQIKLRSSSSKFEQPPLFLFFYYRRLWFSLNSPNTTMAHHFHFFSLFLLLQLIVTVANGFNTINTTIPGCPLFDCGNGVNIKYPFWVPRPTTTNTTTSDTVSSFCGYPDLKVTCAGNVSTFGPVNDNFIVTNIDYQRKAFFLVDSDVIQNHNCPIVRRELNTINTKVFNFTSEVVNLTFFYNCSFDHLFSTNNIPCLDNKENTFTSYVFVGQVSEENVTRLSGECKGGSAVAPVLDLVLRMEDISQTFGDVMKSGFVLEWKQLETDNCGNCESSGGYCGYLNNTGYGAGLKFACFCKDGLPHSGSCDGGLSAVKKALIATCSILGFFFLVALGYLFVWRTKNKKRVNSSRATLMRSISSDPSAFNKDPESQSMTSNYLTHIFSYKELEDATDGFSSSREVGDGGFGTVYKGSLRDGRTVAVKRLYENNYKRLEQFMNEVAIVHRLRHPCLVSLYGCTSRHSRELLLVYEYVPNGTVADHLHGARAEERALTWSARVNIAIETADALAYLHANEPQIIHRDVKTNNILLDNSYHVKVADFGLSREFPLDATHVSTAPQGTPGYVDPEYHQCYHLTDKSDVYSFGVVLVELISSKPAVDITRRRQEINLSNMAINKIREGLIHELADPELGYDSDPEVKRMIDAMAEVAFLCLQAERDARPTMKDVKAMLINIVHGDGNEKNDDGEKQMKDDAYLLNSNVPPSPDTVTMKWHSTTTTPNTSA